MADQGPRGFYRVYKAAIYSCKGVIAAWKNEAAFRQEIVILLLLLPPALWLCDGAIESSLVLITGLLIPVVELLNSAIEAVVDRVGAEHHELSGRAKDMASAAVLITCILALLVWSLILLPKLPFWA